MSKQLGTSAIANKFIVNPDIELGEAQETISADQIRWPTEGRIEAKGVTTDTVVARGHDPDTGGPRQQKGNHLLYTVKMAYDHHYPLVLAPDHIWLAIAQGFSHHVNENAEELRSKFVDHAGKEVVRVNGAGIKGSPWTPWHDAAKNRFDIPSDARAQMEHQNTVMDCEDRSVLDKFVDELRKRVKGGVVDNIMPTFSTTTIDSHAAMAVTTMATFQSYFEYRFRTCCGIPEVTLLGEVDDWKEIRKRAEFLGGYNVDFWLPHLLPVLDKLVESAEGNPDPDFWNQIIQIGGGSGGPFVTGWINALLPYMESFRGKRPQNQYMDWQPSDGRIRMMWGGNPDDYAGSNATCPFVWEYYSTEYNMEFAAGLVGTSQDPVTLAVQPEIGWAVAEV
jgi:hypothetical protein